MDEDIVAIVGFFITVVVITFGIPILRVVLRRWDRPSAPAALPADTSARLERIEQAIDAISVEVERIAEGQRFVTRLMSDRSAEHAALPQRAGERGT